jgi:hypothetical protein
MSAYLVSYDLDQPGKDYTGVIAAIQRLGGVKVLYSEWVIPTVPLTTRQVFDKLAPFIDANDRVLIIELGADATWYNLMVTDNAVNKLLAA